MSLSEEVVTIGNENSCYLSSVKVESFYLSYLLKNFRTKAC